MALDFAKLKTGIIAGSLIEPRKIFTTLARNARFKRPSDEQAEVLDNWFAKRSRRDNTIKMNTGSGKTLVGLLVLQSSLNEGFGPAVYITPDTYLATQVAAEARDLGITTTLDEHDSRFLAGKAILIANIHKLINGRSVFGVGDKGVSIPLKTIIVDDAHACLIRVAEQFSFRIEVDHPVYEALFEMFREKLEEQSKAGVLDVEEGVPEAILAVPYWAWQDRQIEVMKLLHAHRDDDSVKWAWPLLRDVLDLCQCIFGGQGLEIAPRCLPIDVIPAFTRADRRIYMTATLADDGVLVTHLQAGADQIADPIKPKGAGDIGDRMILAPQEINPAITTDEVKALAAAIAKSRNVAVIVPSAKKALYWKDVAAQTLDRTNIANGVDAMKKGHVGLTVLVNKYDGVDLPGSACELLIIDGLPQVFGLSERVEMALLEGTETQLLRQVQKLEQGMGRGVRSSEDYCVVLLLGARLTQRIHLPAAQEKFTPATRVQLELGRMVSDQVRGKPLSELNEVINLCLSRDIDWIATSRSAIANSPDSSSSYVDPAVKSLRRAFDFARIRRYDRAVESVQEAINATSDQKTKGYYKQQLAEYEHHVNPAEAQSILLSAVGLNWRVMKPMTGVAYSKLDAPRESQARLAQRFMSRFLEPNELIIWINALLEDLTFDPDGTERFEAAVRDLGTFLGFRSQRPEREVGKGPDNLWAIGDLRYIVIECKSGATGELIGKGDCNQLIGSMSWFKKAYDESCRPTPLMFHPSNRFDKYSSPSEDARIIDADHLAKLKDLLRTLGAALSKGRGYSDEAEIARQFNHLGLTGAGFIGTVTTGFKIDR